MPDDAANTKPPGWRGRPFRSARRRRPRRGRWRRTATRSTAGWCACTARRRRSRCSGRATARRRTPVPSGWSPPTSGRSPTRRRPGSAPARAKTGASPAGRAEVLQLCDWVQRELSLLEDDGDELAELEVWDAAMEQASAQAGAHCAERGKLFELVLWAIERQAEHERQGDELDEPARSTRRSISAAAATSLTTTASPPPPPRDPRPTATAAAAAPWTSGSAAATAPSGRRSTMSKRVAQSRR